MKKILIAGYPEYTQNYENALEKLGVCPVTTLHVPDASLYDGLLLPGGGDVDPRLFGQLNHGSRNMDPVLDRLQLAILKGFLADRRPVLGICKGMQLINIFFGGDIFQHLPSFAAHQYNGQDQIHETVTVPGSLLHRLYGSHPVVNSAHHQGVDIPGHCIRYTQFGKEGVVEGLSHSYLPICGVQWHPERMCFHQKREDTVSGAPLLESFLNCFL